MLKRNWKSFATLVAVTPLVFAACTDNSVFGPSADIAGAYQLTIYSNATPLPARFFFASGQDPDLPNGGTWDVTGGTLDLRTDGTFTEEDFITKTPAGGSPFIANAITEGTWGASGNRIQIRTNNGFTFNGTADAFTVRWTEVDVGTNQSFVFQFER